MMTTPGTVFGAGDQRHQRVVHHEGPGHEADPPEDAADDSHVVVAIDPRDAEADRGRHALAIADGGVHDVVQHLLDLQLAGGLQVRARASRLRHNVAIEIGEQAHRLGAAGVDSQHVKCLCHVALLPARA